MISLPPNHLEQVGKIEFLLTDLVGRELGRFEAKAETIQSDGNFVKAVASWPINIAPPGAHHVVAVVYDTSNQELTRVAPRFVSTSMKQGY